MPIDPVHRERVYNYGLSAAAEKAKEIAELQQQINALRRSLYELSTHIDTLIERITR